MWREDHSKPRSTGKDARCSSVWQNLTSLTAEDSNHLSGLRRNPDIRDLQKGDFLGFISSQYHPSSISPLWCSLTHDTSTFLPPTSYLRVGSLWHSTTAVSLLPHVLQGQMVEMVSSQLPGCFLGSGSPNFIDPALWVNHIHLYNCSSSLAAVSKFSCH